MKEERPQSMPRILILWMAFSALTGSTAACIQETAESGHAYGIPLRSDAELAAELSALCETAMTRATQAGSPSESGGSRPILVEFSAAWCSDCLRLGEMKKASALAKELSMWPNTTINVGHFDHHRDILDDMKIESIAHWAILRPANCADPIQRWIRMADRTLEVSSGTARNLTPADLAGWLRDFRRS